MEINKAFKVEIGPNNLQRTALVQHAGAARFAFNWGLEKKKKAFDLKEKIPTAMDLNKELVVLKRADFEEGGLPWLREVSKCAPQEALRNLDKSFGNFFRRCKKKQPGKKGFPKFKSRHKEPLKFYLQGTIKVVENGHHIQLPVLGLIKLKEKDYLPKVGRSADLPKDDIEILSATLSERAGRWFVSLNCRVQIPDPFPKLRSKVVGVDVGIKNLAVTSDGLMFENPKATARMAVRLKLAQQDLSRKKKGSQNRKKAKKRVQKVFFHISNIRKDAIHKATTAIVRSADVICVESLDVKGMLKKSNSGLTRNLSDASMSEFLRQIKYKSAWSGVELVEADRFFPSSKTCSSCGQVKKVLPLSQRVFKCKCGLQIDRDLNAAINLKKLGERVARELAPSSGVTDCGEDDIRVTSVKQKPNREFFS